MKKTYQKLWIFTAVLLFLAVLCVGLRLANSRQQWWIDDKKFAFEIKKAAQKHKLPPELIRAVIYVESGFEPRTTGKQGEIGLMQILPSGAVADWCRKKRCAKPSSQMLMNPELNLEIGCWYLAAARQRWNNYQAVTEMSLAQYNAGISRVSRWKPPNQTDSAETFIARITIPSTRNYVLKIMKRYRSYIEQNLRGKSDE